MPIDANSGGAKTGDRKHVPVGDRSKLVERQQIAAMELRRFGSCHTAVLTREPWAIA